MAKLVLLSTACSLVIPHFHAWTCTFSLPRSSSWSPPTWSAGWASLSGSPPFPPSRPADWSSRWSSPSTRWWRPSDAPAPLSRTWAWVVNDRWTAWLINSYIGAVPLHNGNSNGRYIGHLTVTAVKYGNGNGRNGKNVKRSFTRPGPGVKPECPLGQHSRPVDQLWLLACCVERDFLQHDRLMAKHYWTYTLEEWCNNKTTGLLNDLLDGNVLTDGNQLDSITLWWLPIPKMYMGTIWFDILTKTINVV